jgi:8-oxo-dGTP pyrophosphatase MutT (NUDIX family)
MGDGSPAIAHPAATVVLLRDGKAGAEVLLVRRNERLAFHGGAWVFPGGRIDPEDYATTPDSSDIVGVARAAAVREAREEAGLVLAREDLAVFARWVTPEQLPKRFDAWFFVGRAASDAVTVDGREIHAHCWMRPADALEAQRAGGLDLPPPTFVTLTQFAPYRTVVQLLAAVTLGPVETYEPRLHPIPGGACTLYAGDAAYETGDLQQPGRRHRLWMVDSGWRYERS